MTAVQATWFYVARKFVRRNRLAVTGAALLLLSLAAGVAGTLWQAHIARQERANAEQRFNDARQLANYLLFDLYDSVGKVPGTMPVQAEMAGRTLEYLDRLAAIKSNDPALRLELAQGYLRLGTILGRKLGLGDRWATARRRWRSSARRLAIIEPLVRERPDDIEVRRTHAAIEEQLAARLALTGQYERGVPLAAPSGGNIRQDGRRRIRDDLRNLQDAGNGWQTYGKLMSEKGGYITYNPDAPIANLEQVGELS